MKIFLITLTVLFTFQISSAQEQSEIPPRDINKNEFSINPINIIAFGALDLSYERVISNNTSIGINAFYRLSDNIDTDGDIIDRDGIFDKELALTIQYKYFFGRRIARGFYIEGFGMLSSGEHDNYVNFVDNQGTLISSGEIAEEYTDFALGFAVGGKFVTRNGFFLDVGFGIGRNLFSSKGPEIIVRPNLYLGYRF
ncbi:hypothetical protein [Aquimarina sp. 2201CG14-23]|uniref:hypothetical protein n=1 Tax=Aquimarina mycalae TaxID=3040073 RepID=UPI002477D8F7|nr:hypothetical protein [Aquimarina sp. 2201CG14-23]MDH7446595.1 hypothetical protein [Aquimarina sp. 2201CG14-23]